MASLCRIKLKKQFFFSNNRWCVGVIQFREGNLTEVMKPRDYPLEKARCSRMNYTFYAYTRSCLYWDEPKKRFKGDGCTVRLLVYTCNPYSY